MPTFKDIEEGRSNVKDNVGNNESDKLADRGIQDINGKGLVRLGKWIAERHDRYKHLMRRVHNMIATVTLAEKAQRETDDHKLKATLGYDAKQWVESAVQLRDEIGHQVSHHRIKLAPPVQGKHIPLRSPIQKRMGAPKRW